MVDNRMSWYQQPEGGKIKIPLCGLDGDQPCARVVEQDGSYALLGAEQSSDTGDDAWAALEELAASMNDHFTDEAVPVLEQARREFKLGPNDPLEIRVVVRSTGLKLTFATCENKAPVHDWQVFEKVVKAGQTALGKPPRVTTPAGGTL